MTQKDYVRLAAALLASRPPYHLTAALAAWGETVRAIADTLAEDNPRFNREKFYASCNPVGA